MQDEVRSYGGLAPTSPGSGNRNRSRFAPIPGRGETSVLNLPTDHLPSLISRLLSICFSPLDGPVVLAKDTRTGVSDGCVVQLFSYPSSAIYLTMAKLGRGQPQRTFHFARPGIAKQQKQLLNDPQPQFTPFQVGPPHGQQQSLFWSLPVEIRHMVYEYVYTGHPLIFVCAYFDKYNRAKLTHITRDRWSARKPGEVMELLHWPWDCGSNWTVEFPDGRFPNDKLLSLCMVCRSRSVHCLTSISTYSIEARTKSLDYRRLVGGNTLVTHSKGEFCLGKDRINRRFPWATKGKVGLKHGRASLKGSSRDQDFWCELSRWCFPHFVQRKLIFEHLQLHRSVARTSLKHDFHRLSPFPSVVRRQQPLSLTPPDPQTPCFRPTRDSPEIVSSRHLELAVGRLVHYVSDLGFDAESACSSNHLECSPSSTLVRSCLLPPPSGTSSPNTALRIPGSQAGCQDGAEW